jgi:hypothetical protein
MALVLDWLSVLALLSPSNRFGGSPIVLSSPAAHLGRVAAR